MEAKSSQSSRMSGIDQGTGFPKPGEFPPADFAALIDRNTIHDRPESCANRPALRYFQWRVLPQMDGSAELLNLNLELL